MKERVEQDSGFNLLVLTTALEESEGNDVSWSGPMGRSLWACHGKYLFRTQSLSPQVLCLFSGRPSGGAALSGDLPHQEKLTRVTENFQEQL